ncbi:hypothetical protein MFLAVUS_005307 [Mucor flavus]|uniref:Uncharacterized protein n=1 Tax=Mucor flavus TaxID=439312 RepID=A0ABP9YYC2_9FUNG
MIIDLPDASSELQLGWFSVDAANKIKVRYIIKKPEKDNNIDCLLKKLNTAKLISIRNNDVNQRDPNIFKANPCTVNENLDVFTDNQCSITKLKSHHGFNYAVVSIGALLMVSIVMINAEDEKELEKGREMGYFQYGGSTVIVVSPRIQLDGVKI